MGCIGFRYLYTPFFYLFQIVICIRYAHIQPMKGITMQHDTVKQTKGFLRLPQVLELFPISKSAWWAGVKEGRFPKPVKLTERTTAWRVEDIHQLIDGVNSNE